MRAGLLAVALDLLPSTFIACPGYSAALLHGGTRRFLCLLGAVIVEGGEWLIVNPRRALRAALAGGWTRGGEVTRGGGWRVHGAEGTQVTALGG